MSDDERINGSQFSQIMRALEASQTRLEEKFEQFKGEVRDGQEKVAASAVRKVRQDTPFVFKKKSHQEQAKVNDRIEESITEAETQLAEVAADAYEGSQLASKVESIQQSLKRGKKIVAERQKLLKIADRSEFGWAVVAEYTADELAEDSDDEKRINKAEKAAEKKLRGRRKVQRAGSGLQYTSAHTSHTSNRRQQPLL